MAFTNSISNLARNLSSQIFRPYHDEDVSSETFDPTDGGLNFRPRDVEELSFPADAARPSRMQPALRRIPQPVKNVFTVVVEWTKGPRPPRIWKISPFFPSIQTAPVALLDRYLPKRKHKISLLLFCYFCWILCFVLVLNKSAFADEVAGYGKPTLISCTARFWRDRNGCGVNGNDCRPFENKTLAFRCPANCLPVKVLNPHAVGAEEVLYRPLVVGGPPDLDGPVETAFYRGDSFICGAAIHAGFMSNKEGGCGVVSQIGGRRRFPSHDQNSILSVGFDSDFPLAFQFIPGTLSDCKDLRWPMLAISLTFTILISIFTTSPAVFFGSVFTGLFFHTALVSDPPSGLDYYSLVSSALGRFLPAAFVGYVLYRSCVHRTLHNLEAQIEKTFLWLGPCWVGILNNYTFDKIPIQRLTPHDLQQQPGAVPALIIIILTIFFIAIGQAWAIRTEGRMPRYLAIYASFLVSLVFFVSIPQMRLRIHHYILALLLLPGTALQTRPSLLYQGLLVGLFINGIARWGFDSILQTPDQLRGDAQLGSALPDITSPAIARSSITFHWDHIYPEDFDGISILVNDVERFRGYEDYGLGGFTWERQNAEDPEYFRFAYMSGSSAGDYTKAGIWAANGTWIGMAEGPS